MEVNRLRFIDAILDLCVYHYPSNIVLPSSYEPPSLAIASLYWSGWIIILLVAAFNPSNIGITLGFFFKHTMVDVKENLPLVIVLSVLNFSSQRSSKDHFVLIQCYYRKKPKRN